MQTVGVLMRTLNESELIGRCLDTLRRQRANVELDILVVDSGSTDSTVEIARSHGARIHTIAPDAFDYSTSLNVGIERLPHDLVLILSAHAVPIDDGWVAQMLSPFDDPSVAGVASRQVPWEGAPWLEVERLAQTFGGERIVYAGAQDGILFSNAASCIRRSVWREEPFSLPAAEDVEWAERVAAAGWKVVYEASAAVFHSHDESPRAQARRLIDLHRAGASDVPRGRWRTLREAAAFLRRDSRKIAGRDESLRQKLAHLRELVAMVWWYMVDFSRSGTTAELRRELLDSR
jgi:rhamnosyltransferase